LRAKKDGVLALLAPKIALKLAGDVPEEEEVDEQAEEHAED
jgi:hypothetical protein